MAKVEIKYKRGGKIKSMDERYAKALVGAKMAEYVILEPEKQTYKTRELKAETLVKKKPGRPKKSETAETVAEEIPVKQTYSTKDMSAED